MSHLNLDTCIVRSCFLFSPGQLQVLLKTTPLVERTGVCRADLEALQLIPRCFLYPQGRGARLGVVFLLGFSVFQTLETPPHVPCTL